MENTSKKRILYIDDELDQMAGAIEYLRIYYDVDAARTVNQAIELLERHRSNNKYDIIILDVRMPQSDLVRDENRGRTTGISLTKKIRELGFQTPIIVYTVVHDPEIHEYLTDAGVAKVFMKTSSVRTLNNEIRRILENQNI